MILTITLNPAVDKTVEIKDFKVGSLNRISSIRLDAGGKGINVSKVIKSLRGKSKAIGILGGGTGSFIKDYLDRLEIENEFLFVEGETRTNLKILDRLRGTNTDINEPGPQITTEDIEAVERILLNTIDTNAVAVFSGSVPAGVDNEIYGKWIADVKKVGARAVLDADGELLKQGIKQGPYLVKPNIHELERLFDKKIDNSKDAERLGRSLLDDYGIEIIVISLGERGAIFINKKVSLLAQALKIDVKSTVGAGDSMVAALAYCMDRGYDFEKAVRLSMASSIANVMTSGSQAADYETIAELEKQIKFETIYIT